MEDVQKQLDEAVGLVAALAQQIAPTRADSMTIDFQESGEHPYRILTPDETLPMVGMAVKPLVPNAGSSPRSSVAQPRAGRE